MPASSIACTFDRDTELPYCITQLRNYMHLFIILYSLLFFNQIDTIEHAYTPPTQIERERMDLSHEEDDITELYSASMSGCTTTLNSLIHKDNASLIKFR